MTLRFVARVAAASALVLAAVSVLLLDGHGVSWLAGVLAGAGAGGWIALGRRADSVRRGSLPAVRAERRTEQAMSALEPAGWRFVHQVCGSEGVYDHVAVGHGGLLVFQTLEPGGTVVMRGGEPVVETRVTVDSEPTVQRLRSRAVNDAQIFRADLHRVSGMRTWVQAVVVLWCDFPAGVVTDGRCVYVHGSRLAEWLRRRPQQYDPVAVQDVYSAVATMARTGAELPLPAARPTAVVAG